MPTPEWQLSDSVRNADKAAKLTAQYLNIRVVRGDLASVDIIEGRNFANSDHVTAATTIPKGYNDWEGMSELPHMPPDAVHRNVNEIVIDASKSNLPAKATWNNDDYYLAENGPFVWGDIQRAVTKAAFEKNLIPSPEVEQLNDAQIMELILEGYYGFYAWGTNWACYSCP
ncbi:hypothetical protein N7519_000452 [Penicillium mononematosum]|uniref:uncharacterized protein n=1 Tax=Penicillium mononematosum TaxID=268346 RepID=UPI002547E846|nr:uncharacterized protein N7519_000452 [Penicillium mononematosum]KAJ6190431.1 hypothetical protein N7519_000452 [Penicillium mononematosum]